MSISKHYVLAAGGTGGHMVPAHALAAELMRRGWSEADIRKLAGENMLRVMRAVEAVAASRAGDRPGMAVLALAAATE